MQIHELNTFSGAPGSGDYLAIDDGSTTKKIAAPNLGISTAMTQAEAEAGTSTSKRVITPAVFKSAVLAIAKTISDTWLAKDTVHVTSQGTNGEWSYRKWSDGTVEAWYSEYINQTFAFTTHSGSNYYYTNADWVGREINLPSGIMVNADTAFVNVGCNGYINAFVSTRTATRVTVRAFMPYSATPLINCLQLYVKGRWE